MSDGGWVTLESGVSSEARKILAEKGHQVRSEVDGYGGYQAILYDAKRDLYIGASDFRKDGQASGY